MAEDIYLKLRERLDTYALGYPETESGVEIRILKKIFTEREAELFLHLGLSLETVESVAEKAGTDPESLLAELETMAKNGVLFRYRKGDITRYSATPYMVGFYEYQLDTMDEELAGLTEAYFKEGMLNSISTAVNPLRTIPVNESIDASMQIAPYADARKIIKNANRIAVARCICRVQQEKLNSSCDKPQEVCFSFGSHADYYVENGLGRYIDEQEALALLARSEKEGLVAQPGSTINPGGMCNCCGDCCGILRALQLTPRPADLVMNKYFAVIDPDECTGCETCLDRCQMNAISITENDLAAIQLERCIGCGLCVTTCPGEAISMKTKPESEFTAIPESGMDLVLKTAKKRGISPF